jgi:hypothetical protein
MEIKNSIKQTKKATQNNGLLSCDGKRIERRQKIEWDEVESYVKRYVGEFRYMMIGEML